MRGARAQAWAKPRWARSLYLWDQQGPYLDDAQLLKHLGHAHKVSHHVPAGTVAHAKRVARHGHCQRRLKRGVEGGGGGRRQEGGPV